ncbi:MAG: DDE-type integrase/transposase/recombinase [Lachnospiraceae bacterium]|nr:DDE-type integrase/transposase/recombinase [Lachnospiraceae bacterium]
MATKDQKRASDTADERMKLVAPLLDPNPDKNELQKRKMEVCESGNVSLRTLNRYLQAYETGGYSALIPQGRSSTGFKIPDDLVEAAIQLRREVPERSIPTIIQILELDGKAPPGFLKRSTLQDALSRKGYSASMMKIYTDAGYGSQRFQRTHRNDLWQGDIKYGPVIRINGENVQTYLSCLIDDCTRYIVHAEFYGNMEQGIVEDTLRKAIKKAGVPRRLYFDNGTVNTGHIG